MIHQHKALTSRDYHHDTDFAVRNDDPSKTQQSDARDTDINVIMKRYEQTGQLPAALGSPLFGDFTNAPDYRQAVEAVNTAHEAFMQIPAKVRAQFNNDPQQFIEFATNPANAEELLKMGLAKAPPPKETTLDDINQSLKDMKPKEQDNGSGPSGKKPA